MGSLGDSLSHFLVNNDESRFDNPFDDTSSQTSDSFDPDSFIEESKVLKKERKAKKKKKDKFSEVLKQGEELIDSFRDDDMSEDLDDYLSDFLLDDEDGELKRNLIRYGRKYARDTKMSAESSEISKTYSESEKLLDGLLKELDVDTEAIQKDITNMRMMRTRNYKTLSDLIESKATFHNTKLSVIKEMNAMKKNQIELQMKVDKTKKDESGDDSTINRTIQSLFGMGRDSIISSYSDVSGSVEAGATNESSYGVNEDELIQKKYFDNESDTESDGDKFLKYEGRGVHYILLYDDEGPKEIIAEDNEGNIVPDYPTPTDPSNLDFTISESTGTATDNLANQYELRKI